jgi:hypothetical protein
MMINGMINAARHARRLFSEKMHTQGSPDNRPTRGYPRAGQFIWVGVYGTLGGPA